MLLDSIEKSARHLAALPALSDVLGHPLLPGMEDWLKWSRYWQQIVCMVSTHCWVWTGKINREGYGVARIRSVTSGDVAMAHRVMYTWLVGPIPRDMTLDHLCRNTTCVNPSHLEVVSRDENTRRATTKEVCIRGHNMAGTNLIATSDDGRRCRICQDTYYERNTARVRSRQKRAYVARRVAEGKVVLLPNKDRTHCKWGHEFTPENTRITNAGVRQCRACAARRDRERYANDEERKASVKARAAAHRARQSDLN